MAISFVKDAVATVLTALSVLVFFASDRGWDVALVGDSHRWAAGAILLLGIVGCGLGEKAKPGAKQGPGMILLTVLGVVALVFAVLALATGSLTMLALQTASVVALWLGATVRHIAQAVRPAEA
jgi:hypothetical protein